MTARVSLVWRAFRLTFITVAGSAILWGLWAAGSAGGQCGFMPSQARAGEAGILSQVYVGWFRCAWLGSESCCVAEVFECLLVCVGGLAQRWGGWVGELG